MDPCTVLPSPNVPAAVWTIVVAAGTGQRFGTPKQFEMLGDRRVVDWAVAAAWSVSAGVVVVVPPGEPVAAGTVAGGPTRSASVRRGLAALPADTGIVVVHDGARPFASPDLFHRVVDAVAAGADGAVPGLPITDTVKQVSADGVVVGTPDRSQLVTVQTPQAFTAAALRAAHADPTDATDDATLVEARGGRVVVVPGQVDNRKLTVPEDLDWARARVAAGDMVACG
jgi:2-C-methyl-D-erythritol 4-phosphate cytidylyltransferase